MNLALPFLHGGSLKIMVAIPFNVTVYEFTSSAFLFLYMYLYTGIYIFIYIYLYIGLYTGIQGVLCGLTPPPLCLSENNVA